MKARFSEKIINLRAENEAEKQLLDEMWNHGIVAFGGGSELGICSKNHFGSATMNKEEWEEFWAFLMKDYNHIVQMGTNRFDNIADFLEWRRQEWIKYHDNWPTMDAELPAK